MVPPSAIIPGTWPTAGRRWRSCSSPAHRWAISSSPSPPSDRSSSPSSGSPGHSSACSSAYMLPGAFFALPSGVVGQRLGERRTVVGSLALMVVGGLVTAASPGFTVAAAGRLLSGIGAVLMNILLAKMVADWFAEREMSTAMAVMLTSWPVGLGVAAATLGGLATRSSWRMAIVATALAAALGLGVE